MNLDDIGCDSRRPFLSCLCGSELSGGLTIGGGRQQDSGTNFAAILRALASNGDTNVVSMPSVITLDNEEAQIKVAQEVPFLTGSFASTGTGGGPGGAVNPFQTIERKEVGNILKITPQITDEDTILLKIEQEASGIAAAAAQVSTTDLVTNKRTISTRVLVDDGGAAFARYCQSFSLKSRSGAACPVRTTMRFMDGTTNSLRS